MHTMGKMYGSVLYYKVSKALSSIIINNNKHTMQIVNST